MSATEKVRNRVRDCRLARELTQAELARLLDVSRQTIISLEKDGYNPSIELCLRVAVALNTSVADLFYIDPRPMTVAPRKKTANNNN